ncbi:MAG: glycosyltransferase family 9 protein [Gemmatimonadetes bacterium]|nr:glycosyltransferase family 9 protein [Gemmatimonadota bacterium]
MSDLPVWNGGRLGIVMMSALGDAVHVLPLLDAIKRHAPSTHLTWVLQPGPAEMVRGHPHVDDTVIFRRHHGLRAYTEVRRQLRDRPFDLVLNLQVYFKAGLVTWLTRAPVKLGFDLGRARDGNWLFTTHRIPPHPQQHVQDQYLEFLDAIGVPHGDPRWNLGPAPEERAAARKLVGDVKGPLVGFVVATSKPDKNWPPERFADVATRLGDEVGARCVLLGGTTPLETAAAAAIRAHTTAEPIDALGSGLRTLLGLLDSCDLVITPDTGPYHMCVAMNVPAVGLYGYTNPRRVGPYRRFTDLVIDAYGDPGENYPISMAYRRHRMPRITVEQVMEKARLALARHAAAPPWRRARTPA